MTDFECENCGHTESKTGKIGNSGYDKVKKLNSVMSGTGMFVSCCASCGHVHALTIEDPDKL